MAMPRYEASRIDYLRFMLEQLSQRAAAIPDLAVTAYILSVAAIEAAELEARAQTDRPLRPSIGEGK